MKILLDTHIALWSITDSKKLPEPFYGMIIDGKNLPFVSIASVWEVSIKHSLHPEDISMSEREYVEYCKTLGYVLLPIETNHIYYLSTLTRDKNVPKHNDPFDRIMIAQAKSAGMVFLTHDRLLPYYNEECIMFV